MAEDSKAVSLIATWIDTGRPLRAKSARTARGTGLPSEETCRAMRERQARMAMNGGGFGYQAILKSDMSGTVTSLIAYEVQNYRALRAVMWSVPRKAWIYAPAMAATFLFDPDYQERLRPLDRAEAEHVARETLRSVLPTEQTLLEMLDEGQKMGWDFGPPRE
jgi:hypothetical protein